MRAMRAFLLELRARHRHRLALLAGDPLHFAVDFFLRGADGFALGDLIQQQRRLHVARGAILLRLAHFVPIQLEAACGSMPCAASARNWFSTLISICRST